MKREILYQSGGKSGSSSPNSLSPSRKYVFRFIYAKKKHLNSKAVPIATRWLYLECYCSWETFGWQLNSREEHYKIVFCFPLEIAPSIFFTTLCTLPSIHWELRLQDNIFFLQLPVKKKMFVWFQRYTGIKSATFSAFGHLLNIIPSDLVGRRIRGMKNSN